MSANELIHLPVTKAQLELLRDAVAEYCSNASDHEMNRLHEYLFSPSLWGEHTRPIIIIELDGGLVSNVRSNCPADVLILDNETTDYDVTLRMDDDEILIGEVAVQEHDPQVDYTAKKIWEAAKKAIAEQPEHCARCDCKLGDDSGVRLCSGALICNECFSKKG